MWGNFTELTKQLSTQLSENASQLAASSGLEEHLEKAKTSVAGGLDVLASNILTVEPAAADRQDAFSTPAKPNGLVIESSLPEEDGWSGDDDIDLSGEGDDVDEEGAVGPGGTKTQPDTPQGSTFTDISLEDTPQPGAARSAPRTSSLAADSDRQLARLKQSNQTLRTENAELKKRAATAKREAKDNAERADMADESALRAEEALSRAQQDLSSELQAEVGALRRSANEAQEKCLRLEVALEEAKREGEQERADFERQLQAVASVIEPPSVKVGPAPEEMEDLRAQLEEERVATRKWEAEANSAHSEVSRLKQALARLEASASKSHEALATVLEKLQRTAKASDEARAAVEAASERASEVHTLEQELLGAQLAGDAAPAYRALGLLHKQLQAMSAVQEEAALPNGGSAEGGHSPGGGSTAEGGHERVAELARQLEATYTQLREAERSAAAAASEADLLRHQASELQCQHEKAVADSEEAMEALSADLQAVRRQMEEKAAEVPVLQSEIAGLTAALNSALADAESKGADGAGMAAQIAHAESELASMRAQLTKMHTELKGSRKVVKERQQEASKLEQRLEEAEAAAQAKVRGVEAELAATREKHQEAIDGYCAELEALHLKLQEKGTRAANLEGQLAAVQEGSSASQKLAQERLADMHAKMESAQSRAALAETAAKEADEAANAAMEAAASAQLKMADREDQLRAAEAKAANLTEQLALERETAAVDKTALEGQFESLLARKVDKARAEGREEGVASMQDAENRLEDDLDSARQQLDTARAELEKAKAELLAAGEAEVRTASVEASNRQLQEELQAAFAKVAESREAAEAAAKESAAHRATAAERTKKFALLQAQFRKKEDGLLARAEAAEAALESAKSSASDSGHLVREAAAAREEVERERDAAVASLEEAEAKMEALCASLEEQREQCDAACSKVAALEVSLDAAQAAAEVGGTTDQEYFERMVAAEVASHIAEADKRVAQAQAEVTRLEAEMGAFEERATMAEQAKIEMSLVLAQLDEGSQINKPISGIPTGGRSELLQEVSEKAEEAELAAAVSMRRAATAERELAEARQQLAEIERRNKDLSWQVKMLSEPNTIGGSSRAAPPGSASQGSGAGSSLFGEMFGCGGGRPGGR